jgi:tetratricopeptide (TPR) repeat protein
MKGKPIRRVIATLVFLLFALFAVTIGTVQISAQQPTPTPGTPVPTSTPTHDLENRIYRLEVAQTQNQIIMAVVGGIFAVLVGAQTAVQSFVTIRQSRREEGRDKTERDGIKQVSDVMDVVHKILDARFKAEDRERKRAIKAESELQEVRDKVETVEQFILGFQMVIKSLRQNIEERAFQLVQTPRHGFRGKTDDLNHFAQQFDMFKTEFETLEEKPEGERPQFSPRVLYIRGIAAHYANQPDVAKEYLDKVVDFRERLSNEEQEACNRRVANAYYYLGLTQSNFANYQPALNFFAKANELDPDVRDFLTRVVTAEAYVMARNFKEAKEFIRQVKEGVLSTERDKDGRLLNFYLRLQSRAVLVEANIAILRGEDNWHQEAQDLLGPVHEADLQYYYATATLAQVHYDQGNHAKARELFREAYETIRDSGHLITVTEARSGILLLMVAGLCCMHSFEEDRWSKEHLDRAHSLLGSLPQMGLQTCTVFSFLSKRNESRDVIQHHIELIREGKVLL